MAQVTRAASAADYRRFAAECLHLAERYPISKATLIAMAAAWQRMAEFADEWRLWSRSRMIWIIPDSDNERISGRVTARRHYSSGILNTRTVSVPHRLHR
jgi:hypothetical protein